MRRALLGVLLLVCAWNTASAQRSRRRAKPDRIVSVCAALPPTAAAETCCVPGGVQSLVNMEYLTNHDTVWLASLVAHELIHQQQMSVDRARRCAPTWEVLLPMEVEAYCDGTVPVLVARQWGSQADVYQKLLDILEYQFVPHLSVDTVTAAWAAKCGKLLEES